MKKKLFVIVATVMLIVTLGVSLTACNKDNDEVKILFGKELLALGAQSDILTQLNNGSADIGVMDSIMAGYYMTTGSYASTLQAIPNMDLSDENYGIAAKKSNASLIQNINEALIALFDNGTMNTLATEYGLTSEVVVTDATTNPLSAADNTTFWATTNETEIIIGYTEFAPIAFKENDELIGYDIELAEAAVAYLNTKYSKSISVEFLLIEWAQKETLIENGSIDLLWNGMTINAEREAAWTISIPYLKNEQTCIIRKADAAKYDTIAAFLENSRNAIVAVESGSAAHEIMELA